MGVEHFSAPGFRPRVGRLRKIEREEKERGTLALGKLSGRSLAVGGRVHSSLSFVHCYVIVRKSIVDYDASRQLCAPVSYNENSAVLES